MSFEHGAFQEGRAAGYLYGDSAVNPYTKAAQQNDWSALVHCASDWESGKITGIAQKQTGDHYPLR